MAIPADRYPPLQSLRFIPANDILPDGCNTWSFDRGFFYKQIRSFYQQPTDYVYKVQAGDVLGIYLDSVADHITRKVINYKNEVVHDFGGGSMGGTAYPGNTDTRYGQQYYTYAFKFDPTAIGLPYGYYYIIIEHLYYPTPDARNTIQVSECFRFRESWPKTMLLKYTHNINNYDIRFEDIGPAIPFFIFRAEMVISEDPAFHDTSFENMNYQPQTLQSVTYRVCELMVGSNGGVAPWVLNKINKILGCSSFFLDNTQYVKETNNAQWSVKKLDNTALKAGSIVLREADHDAGYEYYTPFPVPEFRIHDDTFDDTHD